MNGDAGGGRWRRRERRGDRGCGARTDGATVRIRRAGPDDRDEVLRLYEGMSPENLRLRFFAASHRSAELAAARVTG
ncbi:MULTISPECIES: hypothetical protein [unclassified Streptomyces]|uniref:hypothetical protein n=1 Tax=unclassified Streptomyces TaxID=2593676 RepID=UPI003867256A|nr:hypothetical protein OG569_00280 [Streptomyces sp. NBC_00827]